MSNRNIRLALAQLNLDNSPQANLAKCLDWTRRAAGAGAGIVCLPELYSSFYFCQTEDPAHFDLAEPADGPSSAAFGKLAAELGVVVVVPFFERRIPGVYHNSAAVIDADGRHLGLYRKMHIPDDPGFYEKYYFTPGDLGFSAWQTRAGSIGVLICWDQWYPEAARLTALRGAELLLYPTAIGWSPHEKARLGEKQLDAWVTVQRGHAVANGVFVAAVNRVGREQPPGAGAGLEFWGSSFICGPQGEMLARGGTATEELVMADLDLNQVEAVRRDWPFLRDRRIDAFHGLSSRALDA